MSTTPAEGLLPILVSASIKPSGSLGTDRAQLYYSTQPSMLVDPSGIWTQQPTFVEVMSTASTLTEGLAVFQRPFIDKLMAILATETIVNEACTQHPYGSLPQRRRSALGGILDLIGTWTGRVTTGDTRYTAIQVVRCHRCAK